MLMNEIQIIILVALYLAVGSAIHYDTEIKQRSSSYKYTERDILTFLIDFLFWLPVLVTVLLIQLYKYGRKNI